MHLHLCCYNNKMASAVLHHTVQILLSFWASENAAKKVTCSDDITIQNKQSDGGCLNIEPCNTACFIPSAPCVLYAFGLVFAIDLLIYSMQTRTLYYTVHHIIISWTP